MKKVYLLIVMVAMFFINSNCTKVSDEPAQGETFISGQVNNDIEAINKAKLPVDASWWETYNDENHTCALPAKNCYVITPDVACNPEQINQKTVTEYLKMEIETGNTPLSAEDIQAFADGKKTFREVNSDSKEIKKYALK